MPQGSHIERPYIPAKQGRNCGCAERAITDVEAERLKVAILEAAFALGEHVKGFALSAFTAATAFSSIARASAGEPFGVC